MNEGAEIKEKKRTGLVIVLGVLCAIAIVLVIIIVAMNIHKDDTQEGISEVDESVLPEELRGDNLSPADQVTKTTSLMLADPKYNFKDIEQYYDTVIEDATNKGETSLAIKIVIQKMDFLVVTEGDCREAKKYINSVDLSPYSKTEKYYLASRVVSMTIDCDDQELQNQWETFMNKLEVNIDE